MWWTIVIILIVLGLWQFIKSLNSPEKKIEEYDEKAESWLDDLKTLSRVSYGETYKDEELIMMQEWFLRLKEKFKHNKEKLVEISKDWFDYVLSKTQLITKSQISLDTEDEERSREYNEQSRKIYLAVEEIENRFASLLGEEQVKNLKKIRDKRDKEAKEFWGEK